MATTHLHQLLQSLCWNTEWSYAVFWKLKQHATMVLTWEDGYYNNQYNKLETSGSKNFSDSLDDYLGLAVAKMSYHVHSLGKGIVGQVAVTGKHQWIFSDEHARNSYSSSFELCEGWQDQFAAGIKTIVVASVVPHGVLQLGSLNKVNENPQYLAHVRDAFYSLQDNTFTASAEIKQFTNLVDPNYLINHSKILNPRMNENNQNFRPSNSYLTDFTGGNSEGILNSSFMFSGGNELHEALGPVFMKQCYAFPNEAENLEMSPTIPEPIESSMVTSNSGSDHLLEAVVADFYQRDSRKSFSNSDSMMTTEGIPEPSISASHTIGSSRYSMSCSSLLEESIQNCLNSSDSCGIRSSGSVSRERLVKSGEPSKGSKKRARPGENSRPRPRDRQLIQDRIKELRELVPNGSKCSIDSLLERTIKHMVFMQNVSNHSEKLSKCAKSKGCSETGLLGSSNEQGSSWAVEVGGHMKICPILVENLNVNGQMLIEMLCEDCDHFLEITEAIRSLGLIVLKGITDGHEDKTWMRFIVEGQNNRNLHRMDVLWSLVQILQSKNTV